MTDIEARIRDRAYAIWEQNGRPMGRDWDHWFRASKQITIAVPPPGAVTRLRQAARAAAAKAPTIKERARS